MSLIYDALRQSGPEHAAGPTLPLHSDRGLGTWLQRQRKALLGVLAGVVIAGPTGLWLASQAPTGRVPSAQTNLAPAQATPSTAERIAPAPPPVRAVALAASLSAPNTTAPQLTTPAPALPAVALASSAPAPTPANASQLPAPAAHAQASVNVRATSPDTAPPSPLPASPAHGAYAPAPAAARSEVHVVSTQGRMTVQARDATRRDASADEIQASAVRSSMSALYAAVNAHDGPASTAALAQLQELLPEQSLTLLRARAWHAHGGGDYPRAERLYRDILDRVPDDEHAGVNLALLEARLGELTQARSRLDRLAARNMRSAQIAQARAELDAAGP